VSEKAFGDCELWFVAGSHHLYGEAPLAQVAADAREVAAGLDGAASVPVHVVPKEVVTSPEVFSRLCTEANAAETCVGVIVWMHTFSPAKMWIAGLGALRKPLLHLHTQFAAALPWAEIDMDYMNLHQSAHGDREFAFMATRMGLRRATAVGHWRDAAMLERIGRWSRAACGWREAQHLSVARFGDNMRQVAVTEGDKVAAQLRLGIAVNGYGVGDLAAAIDAVGDERLEPLLSDYGERYELADELAAGGARRSSLLDAARIEVGLRDLLDAGGFKAFTDTFEDLHGITQLPGIAVQRLMADGYGFAGEGDWKTAALVRILKVMSSGLPGGTSFMEDYTYDLRGADSLVLGAHMLEVCPSIAAAKPTCEIHPLSIGGHDDPVRLVFDAAPGPAIVASMIDLGDRFRLLANTIEVIAPPKPLPKLPVARAIWKPQPDFETAAEGWLLAGGAHHTVFSAALPLQALEDFAEIAGIELVLIDERTRLRDFRNELRWNQAAYRLGSRER
jgi:L-arabinose isomerase